jgi:hypothetical protein
MTLRWTVPLLLAAAAGVAAAAMNPANPGFPVVTTVFDRIYDNNNYSALCVACHTRNPGARTSGGVGIGSHFIFGGAALATPGGKFTLEKLTPWTTGAMSRYGRPGDNVSGVGVAGELICESCHIVLINTGPMKLVVNDNETTDPSPLCEGCHAKTGTGHHILTGEATTVDGTPLHNADSATVRNPPLPNSQVTYPGPNAVNCRSCHRPHDAVTQAGARILKPGAHAGDNTAVSGDGVNGMERTTENSINPGTPIVKDYEPLCNACHKVSF